MQDIEKESELRLLLHCIHKKGNAYYPSQFVELYLPGTFADYTNFNNGSNASTPRPTWTASGVNTRLSTTVPLSETHYEAMDFALWRTIGNQVLIKSNINNWIACKEGTYSETEGRVTQL